jgi:two-component system, cell cycle sensor histidine kinase and response regulator CckA
MYDPDASREKPRLYVGLCVLAVLILAAGGLSYYLASSHWIRTQKHDELRVIADLKVNQIVDWHADILADARFNARAPFLRTAVTRWISHPGMAINKAALVARLALIKEMEAYYDVILAAPDGRLLISLDQSLTQLGAECRQVVRQAVIGRAAVFGDFVRPSAELPIHIDTAAPIFDAKERVVAVLLLRTDPRAHLFPLIQAWPTASESAETLLVRREEEGVLFLNPLRHRTDEVLNLFIARPAPDLPGYQAMHGRSGLFEGVDYRGVEVLSHLRAVPGSGWFMVAKVDTGEMMAELHYRGGVVLLLMGLGVLMAGLLVTLSYRQRQRNLYRELYHAERRRREAQEEIRAAFYGIGDGVIATDAHGRITRMNPMAAQLTGWSETEALGQPLETVFRIVHEQSRQPVENPVARVLREGNIVGLANHTLLIARDDCEYPIADSGAPIRDEHGGVVGVVLVFRDQTPERTAEGALRESEERYRRLFEANPQPMWVYDMESLKFLTVNDASVAHYGYSREEFLGMTIVDIRPEEDIPQLLQNVRQIPNGLKSGGMTRHRKKDGTLIDVEIASHTFNSAGRRARLVLAADVTESRRAEAALRESEERLRLALSAANQGLYDLNLLTGEAAVSDEYVRMLGYEPAGFKETNAAWIERLHPDDYEPTAAVFRDYVAGRIAEYRVEFRQRTRDGQWKWILSLGKIMQRDEQGRPVRMLGTHTDITEHRKLEEQLLQAQKMESVGRLAGGIAHDFNNMLGVIIGHSELALDQIAQGQPLRANLREIRKAAQRSADLTRQLLAFARKQTISPKILDINQTVGGMLTMLRRLIGEDVELLWKPGRDLWSVKIDPAQIDQILANLAVNARDAISTAGKLTIETGNAVLDESYCKTKIGFRPGEYVRLAVSDNGCGMSREIQGHLFEPFFTTKEVGKGTGLGLATVYGIVKQNNGFINVYSEPGRGTTFTVYIPRVLSDTQVPTPPAHRQEMTGSETILLVEDEDTVLDLCRDILRRLGYTVLPARTPQEAITLAKVHTGALHLLLTDVVMPQMNGQELKEHIIKLFPESKTLFMSGYTAEMIGQHGILDTQMHFLQKPFSVDALARSVREVLEQA